MADMTRYEKRIRITLMLLICLFFMIVILSILDFQKGNYIPKLHQLILDEHWILSITAVIGLYITVWLIHDFRIEDKELKESARRLKEIESSQETREILHKIKETNKH